QKQPCCTMQLDFSPGALETDLDRGQKIHIKSLSCETS
ncbi:hypothetical protein CDAR_88861, partial [Caerostris darwini]